MKLTALQQQYIAQRAQWYFDVTPGGAAFQVSSSSPVESVMLTGDGLDDLNSAIAYCNRFRHVRIIAEVGQAVDVQIHSSIPLGNAFPKYLPIDVDDIDAIKIAYIAYYGSVSKPPHVDPTGAAMRLPDPTS